MTPLEAAWQAVLQTPEDDQALLVLADALMERGDPQGELIRLHLAHPLDRDAGARHLASHAAALLGDPQRLTTWAPRFERGFVSSVQVRAVSELEALLDRPIGRLLRVVEVSPQATDAIERFVEVLGSRGPRTISRLHFGTRGVSPHPEGELNVAALAERLPALEDLEVATWAAGLEGAASSRLRRLTLTLLNPLRGLGQARFPALRSLSLELPFRRLDLPLSLLTGEVAPALESLRLEGALWPKQLHDLSVSALLRGLTHLDIAAEAETGWYGALLERIDSFAHLERITLLADRHHPDWVTATRAALPQVKIVHRQLRL